MIKVVNKNKLIDDYERAMLASIKKYERATEDSIFGTSDKETAKEALKALKVLNKDQIKIFCESLSFGKLDNNGVLQILTEKDLKEIFTTLKEWAKKGHMIKPKKAKKKKK